MNIALHTLVSTAEIITQPEFVIGMIFFTLLFYRKNKKLVLMQKMIIGEQISSPFELTISQITIGVIAGIVSSIILSYLGVVFDENSAISLIFLISIILMFFKPKYICFSYSGAVLGLISVILSQLSKIFNGTIIDISGTKFNLAKLDFVKIDIVALMTLIGVLHLIEGILVMFNGKAGAIPVFASKDGEIVGGFAFRRYWILPITLMFMLNSPNLFEKVVKMDIPNNWPLINSSLSNSIIKTAFIHFTVVFGGIGYNSVTFTKGKEEKTFISGIAIMIYGILLALVAQLANINIITKILVLIFAPLGHEAMLKISKYMEVNGKPKYISDDEGMMILEVAPKSLAYDMGIRSGDKIMEINDKEIINDEDIFDIIKNTSNFIWFKIKKAAGNIEELSYNKYNSNKNLGIVFVPRGISKDDIVMDMEGKDFKEILDSVKSKDEDE